MTWLILTVGILLILACLPLAWACEDWIDRQFDEPVDGDND